MFNFTQLHCHSNYSFLEGASRIEELLARARKLGMTSLALTDTGGLYGAVPFYKAARDTGIKPILGTELRFPRGKIIFLARTISGYEKLCALITLFHRCAREEQAPSCMRRILNQGDPDLYTILPVSSLTRHIGRVRRPRNIFLELPATAGMATIARLAKLSARLGLPPVATGPVLFATPERYEVHTVLSAIRTGATVATLPAGGLAPRDAYLRSEEEIRPLFAACPEAMENAGRIAADCNVELPLGSLHLPSVKLPRGETAVARLRTLCLQGLEKRYPPPRERATARLSYELSVIDKLNFAPYFLVVHDIVREAHRRGMPTIGRGSAAGSIVSYCLRITHVDPIRHNLFFERFLNPERKSPPDIDLDFSWKRRDEIIDYVYEKYGEKRVAMISTLVTFGARSAVREIGKALGVLPSEIERWTSSLPHTDAASIKRAAALLPECRGLPLNREPLRTIIRLAEAIDGYPRHMSIHTGGIVITPFPLTRLVPLEPAAKGVVVTQYEMRAAEEIGLVKIDLLGQRSLAVLEDALRLIEENHGVRPPVENFEMLFRDEATVRIIRSGRTMGCFYIESPAMRQLLRKLDVTTYEDLVAASSVIRPGVAESGIMKQYIDRHRGREKTTYLHPRMKEILAETHGVMIYQEDVIRVAHLVAGMSLAEADVLRRAMSGKARSHDAMASSKRRFMDSASDRGIAGTTAAEIWRQIESFAEYGFCKAHSASFALLSFQVAFLKAHWPAEFMAAVLSNGGGFYQTQAYLNEARRTGLKILLPDINRSEIGYIAGNGWIRIGLSQVKALTRETMERIMDSRLRDGFFTSLTEFHERVKPNRGEEENLILCGAFDSFELSRPELLWKLHLFRPSCRCSDTPVRRHADTLPLPLDHSPLLHYPDTPSRCYLDTPTRPHAVTPSRNIVPRVPDYDEQTKLSLERKILGVHASCHPLTLFAKDISLPGFANAPTRRLTDPQVRRIVSIRADELERHAGEQVELVGWLVCTKRVHTSRGEYMRFITMEDTTDLFEVVLFPRAYHRYGHLLKTAGPFAVRGRAMDDSGVIVLNAERLRLFEEFTGGRV